MAKFRSPFSTNTLLITQTYHTQSNNTAVDFSAVADTPVYAVADGKVTYRSSELGSYCIQTLDNSDLKVYYVHTYKWVSANTWVKKGQIICYVAPSSVNGNHPTHLHLGLQVGKYLMDYMDRGLDIRAGFAWGSKDNIAIRNAWFNGGSTFDWNKHKDLSYNTNTMFKIGDKVQFTGTQWIRKGAGDKFAEQRSAIIGEVATIKDGPRSSQNKQFGKGANDNYTWYDMKFDKGGTGWVADVSKFKIYTAPPQKPTPPPPPPTDPTIELKKRIDTLTKEIEGLKTALGASEDKNNLLTGQIKDKDEEIKKLKAEIEESKIESQEWMEKFGTLRVKYITLEDSNVELVSKNQELKLKLEEGNKIFIEKILDWVVGELAKIFKKKDK